MLGKKEFTNQFNEDILNCRCAQGHGRYETAAFYRGCAQGILTAMYWVELINEDEYNKMNERIRRSITMEDDLI
jgi:hypothetical protein|nr:MAG TPA: hypothetical protein [Caudoviricetes sp.]